MTEGPGASVWYDTASAEDRRALDPGVPGDLDRRPDVLVVGGGAVGLATAALCTRAGLGRVLVLERATLAAGASGGAAAVLTPEPHLWTDPGPFVELGRSSLALYRALEADWDGALGLLPLEWLLVLPVPVDASFTVPPGSEMLDADAMRKLVPELADAAGGVLVHDQARAHPLHLAAAFARRAGSVATGVEVISVDVAGDRVRRVRTSHGDIEPGAVVFATGVAPAVAGIDVPVPQHLVKGHLLVTEAVDARLPVALATVAGLVGQLPDGRLLAGGTLDVDDESPDVRPEVVESIRRDVAAVLPVAEGVPVSRAWCCFRPATVDEQPVIDRVPGLANAWVTCGHYRTGILMAPATGQALAGWIASGADAPPEEVAPYGLARFRARFTSA